MHLRHSPSWLPSSCRHFQLRAAVSVQRTTAPHRNIIPSVGSSTADEHSATTPSAKDCRAAWSTPKPPTRESYCTPHAARSPHPPPSTPTLPPPTPSSRPASPASSPPALATSSHLHANHLLPFPGSPALRPPPCPPCTSPLPPGLRTCLAAALAALHLAAQPLGALAVQDPPPGSSSTAPETPYSLQSSIQYGVTPQGTIRACQGNINPNCVSTASTNDNYGPAWRASETDVGAAARVLERAVLGMLEEADAVQELQSESTPVGEYRMFGFRSSWGPALDVAEFLIKPELGPGGQEPLGALVTYRGMAGNVRYIWPVQQAVGDFEAQRQRLDRVRGATGWQIIGCDVIECYQFSGQ